MASLAKRPYQEMASLAAIGHHCQFYWLLLFILALFKVYTGTECVVGGWDHGRDKSICPVPIWRPASADDAPRIPPISSGFMRDSSNTPVRTNHRRMALPAHTSTTNTCTINSILYMTPDGLKLWLTPSMTYYRKYPLASNTHLGSFSPRYLND